MRQLHGKEVARFVEELLELRLSYELKIWETEELMDIRIHRALLQEEENRWGCLLLVLVNHCHYFHVCCDCRHGLLSLFPLSG